MLGVHPGNRVHSWYNTAMRLLAFILSSTMLTAAPIPREIRQGDAMDGKWKVVRLHFDGRLTPSQDDSIWTFDNKQLEIRLPNGNVIQKRTLVHRKDVNPQAYDYKNDNGYLRHAMVDIQGDKMTVTLPFNDALDFPVEMKPMAAHYHYELVRVKE